MRIGSFYMRGVRGLPDIELDFVDAATGQVRPRTVIAGSNGTGKTTILEVIYALLNMAKGIKPAWLRPNGTQAGIAVAGLPGESGFPLMIEIGDRQQADGIAYLSGRRASSSGVEPTGPNLTRVGLLAGAMPGMIERAEAGKTDFPNCLYFPSEERELRPKRAGQVIAEPYRYQWTYRFSDSQKWEGSLESFLVAMNYSDLLAKRGSPHGRENQFGRFVVVINRFLEGKRIVGVDPQTFRVQIETNGPLAQGPDNRRHGIEALSSGEKQIVLMLGEIQRRIRRGSVLLLDEPEIHLHPRWQRLLIRALTDLCDGHDAQMIVTTHSEEVANAFYEHERVLLDDVFAPEARP
jgi:energy-coupling factor transporter ATP-binding protein EcfA2